MTLKRLTVSGELIKIAVWLMHEMEPIATIIARANQAKCLLHNFTHLSFLIVT